MSWHGIRTVAVLELRQRLRASRWAIVLGVWFAIIALVAVLTSLTLHDPLVASGPSMYDVVVFFVLGLGMLVVPSLTATSINGDREQGVLATLQTTLLASADIVLGKLLAAWAIAAAFLVTALPFLVWAWFEGGISIGRILLSLLILMLVLAVVCTVGLMFSSLTARPVASAVLTYLALGALVFGTVIGFGLTAFLVTEKETLRVYGIPDDWWDTHNPPVDREHGSADGTARAEPRRLHDVRAPDGCRAHRADLVDAGAQPVRGGRGRRAVAAGSRGSADAGFTPMRWISAGARDARAGAPHGVQQECYIGTNLQESPDPLANAAARSGPVWPYGLGFLLVSGVGAALVAERRVRTPHPTAAQRHPHRLGRADLRRAAGPREPRRGGGASGPGTDWVGLLPERHDHDAAQGRLLRRQPRQRSRSTGSSRRRSSGWRRRTPCT